MEQSSPFHFLVHLTGWIVGYLLMFYAMISPPHMIYLAVFVQYFYKLPEVIPIVMWFALFWLAGSEVGVDSNCLIVFDMTMAP
jgi:hypothetical protein